MKGFHVVAGLAIMVMVIHDRHAVRRHRADKKALRRTRLTGKGAGWLHDQPWP